MLAVKLHILLNELIWEFHAYGEVTYITEQGDLGVSC